MRIHFFVFLLTCSLSISLLRAQNAPFAQLFGGMSAAVGTKVNKIGLFVTTSVGYQFVQFNATYRFCYAWNDLGPNCHRWQQQAHLGGVVGFGARFWHEPSPFHDLLSHQLQQKYSVGYALILYKDNIHSSQKSGQLAFQFHRWTWLIENDLWGGKGGDKYRTAATAILYRYGNQQWGIRTVLWTANPKENGTRKVRNNPQFRSRYGYYDMSNKRYGNVSHGILAVQWQYAPMLLGVNMPTVWDVQMGVDAEQVRNVLQNKLIHDFPIIPSAWNKARNPHIPMIDTTGNPYLYQDGQAIRPARWWSKLGINDVGLY